MENLNITQVAELLKKEGFSKDVVDQFKVNGIDGKALKMLTSHEHMKELGITKMGDRLKLADLISNKDVGAYQLPQAEPPAEIQPSVLQTVSPIDADSSEHSVAKFVSSPSAPSHIREFTITFNVIVSQVCWGWDKTSELYICLSLPELGGMDSIHPFKVEPLSVSAEGFLIFKGFLVISYHIISKYTYIYYKYAARTGRTAGIVAEHIWNVSSKKSVCRCIEIPNSEKKPGGVWEQWDTIVYPKEAVTPYGVKVAPEGYFERLAQKVQQNFGGEEDTINQQITDDPENQDQADERCLHIYLLSHRDRLVQHDFSSRAGVSQMVSTVHEIFEQLHNRKVGFPSPSGDRNCDFRKVLNSQRLTMVMGQWVKSVIHSLLTRIEQCSVDESQIGASLLSSVTVLCIGSETDTLAQLSEETCVIMAKLLRESYRPAKDNTCPALCVLDEHIPTQNFREVVKTALKKLALTILQKSNEKNWRWLLVVPLFHFVSGLNTPFKPIPLDKEIKWKFWKELESARKNLKQTQASYTDALMDVNDLMELDYVFAQVMLYMCPRNDLVVVLQKVDPILASKYYIWYVKNHGKEYITKAKDPEVLYQHVEALHMATFKSSNNESRRKLTAFVKIAHEVMEAIMEELVGISENHCEIMQHITHHVLSVISLKVSKEHGDEVRVNLEDLDESEKPSKVMKIIEQWLAHKAGVGHVKFGGFHLKKFEEEVRVWRVLCKDTVCPENIKEHWIKAVEQLLEKRAKMVDDKTALVLRSDQRKDTPALVSETLIRLATDDLMSPSLSQNELSKRVDILADQRHSSGDVSKLLSRILIRHLEKQYQVGRKDTHKLHEGQILTIVDLISWDVWPIMIKITRDQQSGLFCNMTDDVKKICKSAYNVLQDTCNQIVSGRIIMNDLKVINKSKGKFLHLCTEAAIKDFNLEKWLGHLDRITEYIERVQEFHNMLDLKVQGYEALQEELQEASIKPMAGLCLNWNDKTARADLKFMCCPTVEFCTQCILTPFYTLAKRSEIFRSMWKNKLSGLPNYCVVTQEQIVELVWKATVADCWTLIGRLKDGKILLSEVNEVFRDQNIRQSCHSLVDSLPSFCSVDISSNWTLVETLEKPSTGLNETWINTVCKQVEHYKVSLKCLNCAKALLNLRDKLKLKGDFSCIQVLGDEDSGRLESLSLCDVTDLFQDDIKLLNRISGASEVEYLKSVVNNWTLLEWIMKEFKSVKDLQGFVDLALDTSDATDMTIITLLTNLRTVGSAIGQLLFNLSDLCGLNDLVAACRVFCRRESFDHTLLKVCSDHLGFFSKLKTTQGSLERKTIDEIKTINEFGQIIIGKSSLKICQIPSEVISVRVLTSDPHIPTKEYTFQELQELISLIVLITGKNKAENQSGMHRFLELFRKAHLIAEALIAMHQEGYMESIGDCYCYRCSSITVDELNNKAKNMDEQLKEWTKLVEDTRSRYYPLNSFTNKQLCQLRRELYTFPSPCVSDSNALTCEVKFLLSALLPCASDSDIIKALSESRQQLLSSPTTTMGSPIVSKSSIASDSSKQAATASAKQTEQALEIKELVESLVLSSSERDNYMNMTESQRTEPILTLLAILKSSDEGNCELPDVLESFEVLQLQVMNLKLTISDIYEQINGYLSKRSPKLCLKKEAHILASSDESISTTVEPSKNRLPIMSTSTIDLSLQSGDYLTIEQLGRLLQEVVSGQAKNHIQRRRKFQGIDFEKGSPNLIVTESDLVLKCAMMLYAEDYEMPLPTQEEVLICTSQTTAEEVTLLWRRAIDDPGFRRIFCLLHAEKLSYLVSEECVKSLLRLKQGKRDYCLVIICSKEKDKHCHMVENLHAYLRTTPNIQSEYLQCLERYLASKYCNPKYSQLGVPPMESDAHCDAGWKVDEQSSCVRVVQSNRVGMGKSLYITRKAQELAEKFQVSDPLVTIRVHGPKIAEERIMDQLQSLGARSNDPLIVHIDISPSMVRAVDCLLFSILVLGYFTDRRGKLWRRKHSHLYMIEITLQTSEESASFATNNLLEFVPSQKCLAPMGIKVREDHLEKKKWESDSYQLVYYYLKHYDATQETTDLHKKFKDVKADIIRENRDFLRCIFRHFKATNPSWKELEHFILFLSAQLSAFEESGFCDTGDMSTSLPGMRKLVMKMILQMSKEFTLPSLRDDDTTMSVAAKQQLEVPTYKWKKWNESFHPYLFFNQDNISFTFVGFNVTENGDAIDPATSRLIMPKIMSTDLRSILRVNKINVSEDFRRWKREEQLQKLAAVIGLDPRAVKDPDPTYVLTADNVIKILAIIMRLRCNIPVIIMGETGCGKTQLLRFLCCLIAQAFPITNSFKNFRSLKVHGGTSEETIIKAVEEAETCAVKNSELIYEMKENIRKNKEEKEARETKGTKGPVRTIETKNKEDCSNIYLGGTKLGTVLFFDEANTTDFVDLIKEIMCDHTIHGRKIHKDVRVVAACNPYRLHSSEMIKKLESAGLGFRMKAREMLVSGGIPLRNLVYRVNDLPPSMKSLVYDFGQLSNEAEVKYIKEIVKKHVSRMTGIHRQRESLCKAIADILNLSQTFMRKTTDECSYVSLRDVDRAMIVFKFFYDKSRVIGREMENLAVKKKQNVIQCDITRAVLLALAVCYYARLQEPKKRSNFAVKISSGFMPPALQVVSSNLFVQHVQWCQEIFLNNMGVIGQNIAHNRALRENVMMMVVCINLRIPLFLIGKPGSSKSLAKTIVSNSMRGTAPSNPFLENFKEVQMFSYQCSQLSTSDSILDVFHQAKTIQSNKTDKSKFVSVVVLDEVGLAEDSPSLPLKVLHPLLEDGTEGNSYSVDVVDREDRVAFIGISNWALDPAKMNRGIMVTRCDPDERELTESAREICSSGTDNDLVAGWLQPCFKYFAKAYLEIVKKQTGTIRKEFFGLRDFYSMVKMLYWMCKEADCHPNTMQIYHVVLRNFSGFEGFSPMEIFEKSALSQFSMPPSKDEVVNKWQEQIHVQFKEDEKVLKPLITMFKKQNAEQLLTEYTPSSDMSEDQFLFKKFKECMEVKMFPDEQTQQCYIAEFKKYFDRKFEGKIWPLIHPDCTPAGLIKASLANKERSYHGENRYLLFLTESYAALQTLQHFFEVNYQRMRVQNTSTSDSSSATGEQQPPLILFGSSFPKDKHFTQVCRHINTVKICMETGRTVVLLNLEEVYESLYDALNQYYREYGAGTRFVDIGLQSHRIKCSVHDEFKLILIAEKSVVYDRFPTPLINRLEKHIVDTSTVLNERQKKILKKLTQWIGNFNCLDKFQTCDSFIGYQADTPSAVVLTASRESGMTEEQIELDSQKWESTVFQSCKSLMLEMASPDALIRLGGTPLMDEQTVLCRTYMEEQHHSSLEDFVRCQISLPKCTKGVLMQATTHNQLLSAGEIECLKSTLSVPERHVAVVSCHLQQFDTEYSFTSRVREEYKKLDQGDVLFIVQCDSGHINGDLIACAKYCLEDIQEEFKIYKLQQPEKSTSAGLEEDTCTSAVLQKPAGKSKNHFHVLFTVYLPWKHGDSKSSFIRFWGGDWKCTHIDDFFPVHPFSPVLALARGEEQMTLSQFFHMIYIEPPSPDTPGARATAQELQCDSEKGQTDRKLYVHIQQAVEKTGRLPTGITAGRMKKLNETLLRLLRVERNDDFYDILCNHIHAILQKKEDQDGSQMRKWVYEEATNSLNLQSGGAFMKVLLRRLDRDLTNAFSTIIAAIDAYYNLDLLVNGPPCLVQFWLNAFKHQAVSEIWEQDIFLASESKVSVYVHNQNSFFCCFPFSFIFRDSIENQWRIETSNLGKSPHKLFSSICSVLQSSLSAIGRLLNTVSGNHHIIEMGRLYLMDLISANLPSSLQSQDFRAMETKIVLAALEPEACQLFSEENTTFSQVVVALHIAYHLHEDEICRFKELIKVMPSKLRSIKGYDDDEEHSDERTVVWKLNTDAWRLGPDVLAVKAILKQLVLESVLEPNQKRLVNLMRYYYRVKHLVDQVLNAKTKEKVYELRLEWQKLQVVYKFIEHVILENTSAKNPGADTLLGFLVPYAKRLIQKFKRHTDFAMARTTEILETTLSVMHGDLKTQFRSQLRQIEKSCITFYTDVITSLCFGQAGPPDEKLVEKLLYTVFTASEESRMKTCELTPFMGIPDGGSGDDVPVIRSFLLQLLFHDSSKTVRKYIDKFFDEARRACGPDSSTFRSVTLLYCQCFEDSLYQKVASLPGNKRFAYIYEKMKNSFDSIEMYFMAENDPEIDQPFLEAVGSLRFALNFAADCISQQISSDSTESSTVLSWSESNVQEFLKLTKKSHLLNTADDHKPRLFLFKLLFRRHGAVLVEFCNETQPKYKWLVSELKGIWNIQLADPFAIYDETYFCSAYVAVKDMLKAKGTCQLEFQELQLPAEKFGPLLTLIFLSLHCYHFSDLEMTCLEHYINSSEVFTQHLKSVALAIIRNSFCGSLPNELQFSETQTLQNRHISTLMVHIVTVVLARQDQPLIQPFVCMILNTNTLKDIWMPVMPDPLHANTSLHLGGIFLECPSKHICFVHQTVRGLNEPLKKHSCPDCGKTILLRSAKGQKSDDVKGYTLGVPLPYQPSTIRSLSPVAALVMRVLMHTLLLWTSCNKDDDIKNIQSAIQLNFVEDDSVPRFFYNHLREDLQALGQFLSMNNDDVILLMHLIAKSILDQSPCQTDNCSELLTKEDRNAWEKKFSTEYILPVIQDVTNHIANARIHMFRDKKQDLQLYDLMLKAEKHSLSLTGDLWAFRPRLNLEHISQSLKADENSQKYALLAYFLKEEPMIRATQYLPSILKLQQYLLSKHHHRSSHEQLKDERIIDIISGAENDRYMKVKEMVECTRKAWNLVKGRLYAHGFLKLPKDCLTVTFSDEDCVELLLPRPCGLGIYCYALVAHLVYTHNEFIDLCSEIVVTNTSSQWRHTHHWWKQSICLENVQPCHLVQYEDKLMSIIMAHCHYSLRAGEDVSYHFDFQGLEKQFLNECVYGRPHIEVKELPHMVYLKDVYTAQKFEEIKRRIPQVSLTSDIKKKIITHVKEPHQLRKALDHIDIVLGFLAASSGVKPLTTVKEYAQDMLKIEEFDELIGTSCRLQHVLSLWETVSLELAKQLTVNGEDPFHEVKYFHKPLKEHLADMLKDSLPHITIGSLLNTLNVFIKTHVRNMSRDEAEEKLVTRLAMMYEEMGDLEKQGFPEGIKLCHVVSVWQHVVKYDQELQKTLK